MVFKLAIELVPSTAWYSSIYQYCKKSNNLQKWYEIKKQLFEQEGCKCWICGKETGKLEAHEFWQYDDIKHIQILKAIHHLCSLCHKVKHIGLWLYTEDGEKMLRKQRLTKQDIINHFCKVNNCSIEEFKKYVNNAFKVWNSRSKFQWKQDFRNFASKNQKLLQNF